MKKVEVPDEMCLCKGTAKYHHTDYGTPILQCEKCKDQFEAAETNTCDKCGKTESTYELIWIDAEDFQPTISDNWNKKKDKLLKQAIKKYSALCEDCYNSEFNSSSATHTNNQARQTPRKTYKRCTRNGKDRI